ncbi:hypothetical protein GCM10027580_21010 [Corynebacterium faecale]
MPSRITGAVLSERLWGVGFGAIIDPSDSNLHTDSNPIAIIGRCTSRTTDSSLDSQIPVNPVAKDTLMPTKGSAKYLEICSK